MNPRRIYRSRDRQLAGVAGGMAEYLDIDPTVIRVLWILATIVSAGFAIVAYIVLAIVVPESPYAAAGSTTGAGATGWSAPPPSPAWAPDWAARTAAQAEAGQHARDHGLGGAFIVGIVLVVIGAIALADAALPGWSSVAILGPAVIIALGAAVLVASIRRRDEPVASTGASPAPVATDAGGTEPLESGQPS